MPELPEVEVIRRELGPLIIGKMFAEVCLDAPNTVQYPAPQEFIARLKGRAVEGLKRKGKYLMILLDCGVLVVHLRMTGNLVYSPDGKPQETRFLRATLGFSDGSALHFSDMRRFGRLWLVEDEASLLEQVLKKTGPDIYEELSREQFVEKLQARNKTRVKALLLDQRFASGMGNIYTDECLFRCGLHPERPVSSICRKESGALYDAIQAVLREGIEHGGTSFRDYRNASGALGEFQARLNVYGRNKETCRCGAFIERTVVAGRGTYYCPRCQK